MLDLSEDVLRRIMLFLGPDSVAHCQLVSPQWGFAQDEKVFQELCYRTYMAQSRKKLLNVSRWCSWERMLKLRPRLRTNGMYVLKTSYVKRPVRDMWTAYTPGTILEVTYYRYFRFYNDGRVAYGLTHEPPRDVLRLFKDGSPKLAVGSYTINKWEVEVEIPMRYATVRFRLRLANGQRGHFTHLVLLEHSSVAQNDPWATPCPHKVRAGCEVFCYRRVWSF